MKLICSAPAKAILFGEHYVVYGAPAISIAIEPRNSVLFSDRDKNMLLRSKLGEARIMRDGEFVGPEELSPFGEVARKVFAGRHIPPYEVAFETALGVKGIGTSASLCCAFAAGLFHLSGKTPSQEELFLAAQAGDLAAHGGRASGIDVWTVISGKPMLFQKGLRPPSLTRQPISLSLPEGTCFLLVDTFKGKKESTSKMVEKFALQFGINVAPSQVGEDICNAICEEYRPVWKKLLVAMKAKNARAFGEAMNENHALLRERGVSSEGIEMAISLAIANGAYGAKLTGSGGEGGAVLVFCKVGEKGKVVSALKEEGGFPSYQITIASKGILLEEEE
ncbi:MAG: hypothetical protein N3G22_03420 [Candidatus Micrarchaeota archaeon]|nr:hypothetical protein [Candidatus Micrarchaeota archaeon]